MAKALYMISGRWLRIAPLDSSTPLHTMSYWNALTVRGSCVSSAFRPPCGIENGLWLNSMRPLSASRSNIGKSTIQQNSKRRRSMSPSSSPRRARTPPARTVVELVEEAARARSGAGRRDRPDHGAGVDLPGEDAEAGAAERLGRVGDAQRVAQVGLVGAVDEHRLVERDARKRPRAENAVTGEFREHAVQHRLDRREDVLLGDEGNLEVELVELARRAVGAAVLVAEARRDLEIAVEAGDHQKLLELLRRLRQGIELARMQPARHQEVARAFGRARGQDRRLELGEAGLGHAPADAGDDPCAQGDVAVDAIAAQIEEAVAQADVLARVLVAVHLQGQRIGPRPQLERADLQLDLAGRQARVDGFGRPPHHLAGDADDGLRTHRLELGEQRARNVDDALRQAVMVAQVDEQQIAVIALAEFCRRQARADHIAVDTEFMRDTTYWPQLCLVQIAGPDETAAIDTLAAGIDLPPPLGLLFD